MNGRAISTNSSETHISPLNSMLVAAAFTGKDKPIKYTMVKTEHSRKLEQWAPPVNNLRNKADNMIRSV